MYIEKVSTLVVGKFLYREKNRMQRVPFHSEEIGILAQAIEISEDLISDQYRDFDLGVEEVPVRYSEFEGPARRRSHRYGFCPDKKIPEARG